MAPSQYRSSNLIIQSILEGIVRADINNILVKKGIVKSHLIKYVGLKASVAEKYLSKMEKAGYIQSREEPWGDRSINIYTITPLGMERYQWFMKINAEFEEGGIHEQEK